MIHAPVLPFFARRNGAASLRAAAARRAATRARLGDFDARISDARSTGRASIGQRRRRGDPTLEGAHLHYSFLRTFLRVCYLFSPLRIPSMRILNGRAVVHRVFGTRFAVR